MMLFKIDITHATDALQLTAGQDAEFDADAQAMHDIFSKKKKKKNTKAEKALSFRSLER